MFFLFLCSRSSHDKKKNVPTLTELVRDVKRMLTKTYATTRGSVYGSKYEATCRVAYSSYIDRGVELLWGYEVTLFFPRFMETSGKHDVT